MISRSILLQSDQGHKQRNVVAMLKKTLQAITTYIQMGYTTGYFVQKNRRIA
jgi:hypothetical protein